MKYRVQTFFTWGQLALEKNQIIVVEPDDELGLYFYRWGQPERKQTLTKIALNNMVNSGKISPA